jgi:hypothetical protein
MTHPLILQGFDFIFHARHASLAKGNQTNHKAPLPPVAKEIHVISTACLRVFTCFLVGVGGVLILLYYTSEIIRIRIRLFWFSKPLFCKSLEHHECRRMSDQQQERV